MTLSWQIEFDYEFHTNGMLELQQLLRDMLTKARDMQGSACWLYGTSI